MNSSDGDGSTSGPPDDGDPVRRTPPADPWLDEAPTSVVHGAAPAPGLGPDPAAELDSGWTPAAGQPPRSRGERRPMRWVVAVLAACALLIAGILAVDPFEFDGDDDARGSDPSPGANQRPVPVVTGSRQKHPSTPAPSAAVTGKSNISPSGGVTGRGVSGPVGGAGSPGVEAGGPVVVYEVTASGSHNTGSVTYIDQDGEIVRLNGVALPWRTTFRAGAKHKPLVLDAQRKGGGDNGPVTCRITVEGKVLSFTTSDGRYAAPECVG